jgi:phage tail sheath protein FI
MPTYTTPGVYYERVDAGAPAIAPLRTDIAGFVGIARSGPLHRAVPVDTWRQFQAWFGDFTGAGYLAYAVRAFFENGGKRAWIVRIASPAAAAAGITVGSLDAVTGAVTGAAWRIAASSEGVWGNDLDVRLVETHRAQTRLIAGRSTPQCAAVNAVSGFVRGTQVRIPIGPGQVAFRYVAAVDADASRLHWVHPDPRLRRAWEQPLVGVDPDAALLLESVEYTLLVRRLNQVMASYEDLALMPEHPRYGPSVLAGLPLPPENARGWTLADAPELVAIEELRDEVAVGLVQPLAGPADLEVLAGGTDGLAALTVRDFIGDEGTVLDADAVRRRATRGIRALEAADEVTLVAVPDINIQPEPPPERRPLPPCVPDPCLPPPPPGPAEPRLPALGDLPPRFSQEDVYRVQAALIAHCETRRDRVALLDPPYDTARDPRLGVTAVRAWRRRFDSSYAALYFPWVKVSDPLRLGGALTRDVPPSGHVAGFAADTDLRVGVHKAPANGPLTWIQDLTVAVDDPTHGLLNHEQINALRAFPGRGLRIFGARTLSSDTSWLYLNVRRLLLMIEKAILLSCQWATFEPNAAPTRSKLHLALTSFLIALWQRGALAGKSARAAFFVRCDETNNPAAQRDLGQLLAEVGVAPAKPFEFVVLRVGRVDNQFEVSESEWRGGVM